MDCRIIINWGDVDSIKKMGNYLHLKYEMLFFCFNKNSRKSFIKSFFTPMLLSIVKVDLATNKD